MDCRLTNQALICQALWVNKATNTWTKDLDNPPYDPLYPVSFLGRLPPIFPSSHCHLALLLIIFNISSNNVALCTSMCFNDYLGSMECRRLLFGADAPPNSLATPL